MTDLIEVRVSNLIGAPLDWAVAMAEGFGSDPECRTTIWRTRTDPTSVSIRGAVEGFGYRPSSNWEHGGPLIDKHHGSLSHDRYLSGGPCGYSAGPWGEMSEADRQKWRAFALEVTGRSDDEDE